jgi:hypothetical protein
MTTQIEEFRGGIVEQDDDERAAHHPKFEEIELRELVPPSMASKNIGPRVLPQHILLGVLRDGRLRVSVPIAVRVMVENQDIVLESLELDEFGFGNTLSDAIIDLQRAIAELYFTLEQEQYRLGPDLERVWQILQQKIQRRP